MAHDDEPVGQHDLLPVPPGPADVEQVDVDDVLPHRGHQVAETLDPLNAALALGSLDDHCRVVPAFDGLAERSPANRFRPAGEQVDVAGVVHLVDR